MTLVIDLPSRSRFSYLSSGAKYLSSVSQIRGHTVPEGLCELKPLCKQEVPYDGGGGLREGAMLRAEGNCRLFSSGG